MFILAYLILALPFALLLPTKVIHKERLKMSKKKIITSNHYTNADVLLYDFKFTRKFRYMSKIEMFKNKPFGLLLRSLGAFPVNREKMSVKEYRDTMKLINSKKQVFIFPEGTRNKSGSEEMLEIKSGIITFASKGEADIVPMLMYRPPKIFRKNYIIVGEPFKIEGENTKRLTKEEQDLNLKRYEEAMENLRKELDEYVLSKTKNKHKNIKQK